MQKSQLSQERQRLVEVMQRMHFCSIINLQLRHGQPVFDPPPALVQNLKIGTRNDLRVQIQLRDFTLKRAHVELFQHFDVIRNGLIDELEVHYGLPQMLKVKRSVA